MKIGGSVSYKVNVAPYETMEVSSYLELEVDSKAEVDEIEKRQAIISKLLKDDVNKKAKEFIENFHDKIKRLKEIRG